RLTPMLRSKPTRRVLLSLTAIAKRSMENVLGNSSYLTGDAVKAGKVVDINQHETLWGLQHIDTVEIKPKCLSYAPSQLEHLASHGNFLLLHWTMQNRSFCDCMYLLTSDIQFDINTRILDIAHCQVI